MRTVWLASICLLAYGCMPAIVPETKLPERHAPPVNPVPIEKRIAYYESSKLDKATALAYSLFCPGAGLSYGGDATGAVVSFSANALLVYGFIDAVDKHGSNGKTLFGLLMLLGRVFDIGYSLSSVDQYNAELRFRIGLTEGSPAHKAQPTITFGMRF